MSPDGRLLASGMADGSVVLWDIITRRPSGEPLRATNIEQVAFSPDGRRLAAATQYQGVILWDLATRQLLGKLQREPLGSAEEFSGDALAGAHVAGRNSVSTVAFSPDGRSLASGGVDGALVVWDIDQESWRRRACLIVNRNLSPIEWRALYRRDRPYEKTCVNLAVHPEWIEEAGRMAMQGKLAAAESVFARLNELEPGLSIDPKSEAGAYLLAGDAVKALAVDRQHLPSSEALGRAIEAYHQAERDRQAALNIVRQQVKAEYGTACVGKVRCTGTRRRSCFRATKLSAWHRRMAAIVTVAA